MSTTRLTPSPREPNFRLPRDLLTPLRELAIRHDRSLTAEIREAMRTYLQLHADDVRRVNE